MVVMAARRADAVTDADAAATLATPTSGAAAPAMHAPQPKHASPAKKAGSSPAKAPVFVPFRPERSSPDLEDILLKKKVSDALAKKQTWSIDQAPVPAAVAAARSKAARS